MPLLPALLLALFLLAAPGGGDALGAHASAVPAERALYEDGPDGRHLLERGWTTRSDTRNRGLRERWYRPGRSRGFRRTSVPHAFNARDDSRRGFRSRVQWYRVRFDRPSGRAVAWRLRFESVNRHATVWLNGRRLGTHAAAHLPFELDARGIRSRGNELVVRVDGRGSPRDLPPSNRPRGWWNHGGILREVYLRRLGRLDLNDVYITTRRGNPAVVTYRGMARNRTRGSLRAGWTVRVLDPDGAEVAEKTVKRSRATGRGRLARVSGRLAIPDPREWSPASPSLYTLVIEMEGGQTHRHRFGIREWGVNDRGLATLNGVPLKLRGASFHEETLNRGAALGPPERAQIVDQLKALAADFTREHYPPHPALLEAFDREGIVFWEQIPVWRLRGTQLRSRRVQNEALARLRRAILRDRNHASVMAWSVENETLRGGSAEERYLRRARSLVRRLDRTRLLAADTSLRPLDQVPDAFRLLDAIGVNEYVGWYGDAPNAELADDLRELRRRFPNQALFVTEFGAEANRDGPASEKGTFAFQRDWLRTHLEIIDRSDVSGALVWLLRDFWVRPGWSGGNPRPDPPFNRKGLFDERGNPKPAAETVRELFVESRSSGGPPPNAGPIPLGR